MSRFSDFYFSGSQCEILINDTVITEAVAIEGTMQVEKVPFYGYASRHFDAVGMGRVIAMGSLTINYRFDGYLLAHIEKAYGAANTEIIGGQGSTMIEKPNIPLNGLNYFDDLAETASPIERADASIYVPDDEAIKHYQKMYWNNNNSNFVPDNDKEVRPEFTHTFDIKVRDFRIGDLRDVGDLRDGAQYEEKTLKDVTLNKYSTIRRTDAGAVLETFTFICKTII